MGSGVEITGRTRDDLLRLHGGGRVRMLQEVAASGEHEKLLQEQKRQVNTNLGESRTRRDEELGKRLRDHFGTLLLAHADETA